MPLTLTPQDEHSCYTSAREAARDALLVAIDDLAPARVERVAEA
jgi:hypothetical protein